MDSQILLWQDEDGIFIASFSAIKGCDTQGDTKKEALKNMEEAIELNYEFSTSYESQRKTG